MRMGKSLGAMSVACIAAMSPGPVSAQSGPVLAPYEERLPEDEIIYLIMPDRFENGDPANDRGAATGGPEITGFNPSDKAFYHGGDLKGVIKHLDYVRALGATAIWLTPVFGNKAVQTSPFGTTAGYHGYWGTDFTDIDPHLGTRDDYKHLVEAAHARNLKVYFDIVVNHTADVVKYREDPKGANPYRSLADYPYSRAGGPAGAAINQGFVAPDTDVSPANFSRLVRPDYAYTPYVPAEERHEKKPDWLNDPLYYHNRGESTFRGESSSLGDFVGLDDLFTENPRVLQGMIEIYGKWIDDFGIDGFRIDTARHVNSEFWQGFVPAMVERARRRGIANFHIFAEVMEFEPGELARFTHVDGLPAVNDFALQRALVDAIAKDGPTDEVTGVFRSDPLYKGGEATARQLVTLTGNHDVMRFAREVRKFRPDATSLEVEKRVLLAYAVILTARGVPALYYGDEQGFTGPGDVDQDSREDMLATRVPSYAAEERLGRPASGNNFDPSHPMYEEIARLAALRSREALLRRGRQISRASGSAPGLLAFSRLGKPGEEILAVFNTANQPIDAKVEVSYEAGSWTPLIGQCADRSVAPGSYEVRVPALSYIVCKTQGGGG